MSIDLLHRMTFSERQYRRGVDVADEVYNESSLDEEEEIAIKKRGGSQGPDYLGYYEDEWGKRKASHVLFSELVDQFKEP